MKKCVLVTIVVVMLTVISVAYADDLGIQVIGGDSFATETVSLDNLKLEQTYDIDGYAKITPITWRFDDFFYQYEKNHAGDNSKGGNKDKNPWFRSYDYFKWINIMNSGTGAEFAWFEVDVTNISRSDIDFAKQAEVKVIYDDDYEFAGWVRTFNYDYDILNADGWLVRTTLDPSNTEETSMMYTAHLIFGATLPNAVVEDKAPLRMEINLGGNELTYHIRK